MCQRIDLTRLGHRSLGRITYEPTAPPRPSISWKRGSEGNGTTWLYANLNSRIEFEIDPNSETGSGQSWYGQRAALSPPARSGRNKLCQVSRATPFAPSPGAALGDRDGAAHHPCPFWNLGLILYTRRMRRAQAHAQVLPLSPRSLSEERAEERGIIGEALFRNLA